MTDTPHQCGLFGQGNVGPNTVGQRSLIDVAEESVPVARYDIDARIARQYDPEATPMLPEIANRPPFAVGDRVEYTGSGTMQGQQGERFALKGATGTVCKVIKSRKAVLVEFDAEFAAFGRMFESWWKNAKKI